MFKTIKQKRLANMLWWMLRSCVPPRLISKTRRAGGYMRAVPLERGSIYIVGIPSNKRKCIPYHSLIAP
jgi:hypothetical protein